MRGKRKKQTDGGMGGGGGGGVGFKKRQEKKKRPDRDTWEEGQAQKRTKALQATIQKSDTVWPLGILLFILYRKVQNYKYARIIPI